MKRDFALAAKAVIIRDEKVLLLKRSEEEQKNSRFLQKEPWDLPGGGIRFFETAERGLHREILEETGLQVTIIRPIALFEDIRPLLHFTVITYLCIYGKGDVVLSSEHNSYCWLSLSEMEENQVPQWLQRNVLRGIADYHIWKELHK